MNDKRMEKGEKTRETILNAAIALIAEKGLKEISTAKLATAAGVSKSVIFHHFKSVDEVLTSALHVVYLKLLHAMETEEYRDVEHFLDGLGRSMSQLPQTQPVIVRAFLSYFHEGMFNPMFQEILRGYAEQMHELFRRHLMQLARHAVDPKRIDDVSKLILPMVDGISFHYLLHQDSTSFETVWSLQKKAILHLLNDPE